MKNLNRGNMKNNQPSQAFLLLKAQINSYMFAKFYVTATSRIFFIRRHFCFETVRKKIKAIKIKRKHKQATK